MGETNKRRILERSYKESVIVPTGTSGQNMPAYSAGSQLVKKLEELVAKAGTSKDRQHALATTNAVLQRLRASFPKTAQALSSIPVEFSDGQIRAIEALAAKLHTEEKASSPTPSGAAPAA